jgi:hypothetical protein
MLGPNSPVTFSSQVVRTNERDSIYGIRIDDLPGPVAKMIEHILDCKNRFDSGFVTELLTESLDKGDFSPSPNNEIQNAVMLLIQIHDQRAKISFREKILYTILAARIAQLETREMIGAREESYTKKQLKTRAREAISRVINESIPVDSLEADRVAYKKMIINGCKWGMQALLLSKYIPGAFLLPLVLKADFNNLAAIPNGDVMVGEILYSLVKTNHNVSGFFTQLFGYLNAIKESLDKYITKSGISIPTSFIMDLVNPKPATLQNINQLRTLKLLQPITDFDTEG